MSGSTGGRADKLGNRYEGLWVAYQLLLLLAEQVAAVQLEALGDDEHGVDVWVTRTDGTRDAQQCKRKNRAAGKWGIGELDRRDVLAHMAGQLRRNPAARFTLVSADPAPELRELADTARAAGGDPDAYFRGTLAVAAHADHLRRFCRAVGLADHDPAGRAIAFDLLRRTFTYPFDDGPEGRGMVTVLARTLIAGEPETAVEVLATIAQDRMGEVLTADIVHRHLRDRGLPPARIAGDPQAVAWGERLRAEFRESLRPALIHAALVPRPEAAAVFDLVTASTDRRLVVLHGRGGTGKSCVLLQLAELLEQAGVPYLPLRLDRRPPQTSARRYGIDGCGLPESPAVVLRGLNPGRRAVLIVDQLDAVRWTAAHASAPWEACREVLDDALGLPDMAVVVACRTFDLRDDQQIRAWHAARRGHEVPVGDLPDDAVARVVGEAGGDYAGLTPRQRALLRTPLHLALWAQAVAAGGPGGRWATQADLLRLFWRSRFDAAGGMGVPPAEVRDAVAALVAEMDRTGTLSAPASLLDPYPRVAAALQSLHVVAETGRRVMFAHQSYLEYQLATRLLAQVRAGGQSVAGWVTAGDQSLLRRDPLRLVLTLLRDDDPAGYLRALRDLILAPPGAVRFHLRQLALRLLGEVPQPMPGEFDLVCELAGDPAWRGHVLDQVFTRQSAWAEAAADRGVLARWLESPDGGLVEAGLLVCRWWSAQCGDRIAALVTPYLDRPDPWPRRVAGTLPYDPADDAPALFRIRLQLIRRGGVLHTGLVAQRLADRCPDRVIDLLEAHLDRRAADPTAPDDSPPADRDFPYFVPGHEVEHLERVADARPGPFWDRLMPHLVRACEATRDDRPDRGRPAPFFPDRTWSREPWRFVHAPDVPLPRLVARAGGRVATDDPTGFAARHAGWLAHPGASVQLALGLALAGAGPAAADLAVGWLSDDPRRLALPDDRGRRWGIARQIVARHAAACSAAAYARLERALLRYHDPAERRSVERQLRCVREGWPLTPNECGLAQHALLPCLPDGRLGDAARSEMGTVARKFGRPAAEADPDRWGLPRAAVWPIPADRAARFSDAGWLGIITGAATTGGRRCRRRTGESMGETPAAGFARLLGDRAQRDPWRFAALALRIPTAVDPAYLAAVLHGVAATGPPPGQPGAWQSAADGQVTAVIEHIGYRPDREVGNGLCWLIRQRPGAVTTSRCVDVLCRYATEHPHPPAGWVASVGGDPHFETAALNCTRGAALGAIARILYAHPDRVGEFAPALRRAVADPHPAVRVAAVGLFLAACDGPDDVLGGRRVWEFVRYTLGSHGPRLEPLLLRMAGSAVPAAATAGAAWLTVIWLRGGRLREVVEVYARGTAAQKKGVAMAAAGNCDDAALAPRCTDLLDHLVDDPDDGVRAQAGEFLHQPGVLGTPAGRRLAGRFVAGREFGRHPGLIVEALREYAGPLGPLAPVVGAVCDRLAADLADPARRDGFPTERFVPLLLRLYEQAEQDRDPGLRAACLDWWDRLLEARLGGTIQVLGELDASTVAGW